MGLITFLAMLLVTAAAAHMHQAAPYQPPLLLNMAPQPQRNSPYHPPLESGRSFHQSSSMLQELASKVDPVPSLLRASSEIDAAKTTLTGDKEPPKNDEYIVYYYYYYDNDTAANGSANLSLSFDDIPSLESYDERPNSLSEHKPSSAQPRSVSGGVDRQKEPEPAKPVSNIHRYGANEVPRFPVLPQYVVSEPPPTQAPPVSVDVTPPSEIQTTVASIERPDDNLNSVLDIVPSQKLPAEPETDPPTTTEEPTTTAEPTTTTERTRRRPSLGGRRRFSPSPSPSSFSSSRNRSSSTSSPNGRGSSSTTSTTTVSSVPTTRRSFQGGRVRPRPTQSSNRPRPESPTPASTSSTTPRARFSSSSAPSPRRFQSSRSRATSTSPPGSTLSTTPRPAPSPRPINNRPRPGLISRNRPPRPGFPRKAEPEEPPTTLPPPAAEETSAPPTDEEEESSEEEEEATSSEEKEEVTTTTEANRFSALFRSRNRNLGSRPRPVIGNRPDPSRS